jgi:hypothetical protein
MRGRAKEKEMKAKYESLMKMNEELTERYDAALQITEYTESIAIIPSKKSKKEQATAIVCFSDWHIEERVDSETINGINEYNPKIAEKRANAVILPLYKLNHNVKKI